MPNSAVGSPDNSGVASIETKLFEHKEGVIFVSPSNNPDSTAFIIDGSAVRMTGGTKATGVSVSDSVSVQGVTYISGQGTTVRKREYSENDNSKKTFTYIETTLVESVPKEVAAKIAEVAGVNLSVDTGVGHSVGMDGVIPIVTDVSAGPLPHFHVISMKHVHRIEPAYLYRAPQSLMKLFSVLDKVVSFLKA